MSEELTKKAGKILRGTVERCSSEQTIKVRIDFMKRHPKYRKTLRLSQTVTVHDALNQAALGDEVLIRSCKPFSKTKVWELSEILKNKSAD
jgi:small subunit ribosomal protein S17